MAEATAAIASATIAGFVAMCNANPESWVKLLEMFPSSKDEQEASDILKKAVAVLVCQKNDYGDKVDTQCWKTPSDSYRLWVQTVQEIEEEAKKLLEERNKGGEISVKEIQKLGKRIGEHKEAGNKLEGNLFDYPKPEPVVRKNGTPGIKKYPTLHKPLEEILVFLRDDKVYKIGILGPLGIGKTTIMKNLNNHEQVAKLFDIVIWVKASANDSKGSSSMECMRKVIEQRLKLDFEANTNPEDIKKAISTTLSRKKYLLLLDDVKESLDLEQIGIPENRNGSSKVVLTTRIGLVCSKTVDQVIKVNYLSEGEAWKMFKVVMNRPKLINKIMGSIAWRVCKDCYGLPLLLDKVASTFSQMDNEKLWVEGLNTWRKWPKDKARQGLEELYILFRFCYDSLNDEHQKKCFLYGALYPEDSEINSDYLLECWAAEDLLSKDGDKIENQLISAYSVLKTLKNVSLLEEGKTENHVTMHKFTRQVALYILENDSEFKHLVRTNEELEDPPDVKLWLEKKRISLGENKLCWLPKSPDCKDLSTLFLQKNLSLEEIPGTFFDFMKNLKVLDLSHTGIMSLPPSLQFLIKLKILYLNNCTHLKDLPTDITRLPDLEALDLWGSGIVNIPDYIGNLINLRRLRVSFAETGNANSTKRDQFNHDILSKLSKLEELVIYVKTPDRLSNEVVGNITTSVAPLKNFKSLKFIMSDKVVYYIDIAEPTLRILLPKIENFLGFLQKSGRDVPEIQSFQFIISSRSVEDLKVIDFQRYDKYVKYCNGEGIEFPTEVLKEADAFELVEHKDIKQLSDIDIASMEKIRSCLVESCDAFETVVNATNEVVLPNLEHLCLEKLPKLRSICEGSLRSGTLSRIKTLAFISCPLLTVIFPSGVIEQLGEIEHLTVEDCPKVEKLFTTVANSDVLAELKKLKLLGLPLLTKVYETNVLEWKSLKKVKISKCPKLKTLHFNEMNAPKLEQIKGEQQWWDSIECPDEENKKQFFFEKLFIPRK